MRSACQEMAADSNNQEQDSKEGSAVPAPREADASQEWWQMKNVLCDEGDLFYESLCRQSDRFLARPR